MPRAPLGAGDGQRGASYAVDRQPQQGGRTVVTRHGPVAPLGERLIDPHPAHARRKPLVLRPAVHRAAHAPAPLQAMHSP